MKYSFDQLGKNIAYYRRRAGMTQDMMAIALGVSMQAVSKWERNLSCPDMALLPELSQLLDVTIDELFSLREEENTPKIIDDVPWENDNQYRLALFHGKVLLSGQTHLCKTGGTLVISVKIPEETSPYAEE